jgi:hypothetical protein
MVHRLDENRCGNEAHESTSCFAAGGVTTPAHMIRVLLPCLALLLVSAPFAGAALFGNSLNTYAKHPGFAWRIATASNLTVYFEANTRAERELAQLQARFARSVRAVGELLQAPPYRKRIHVFVVESKERKQALMGDPGWGGAIPKLNVVFGVFNERGDGCSTHEFCHVIAGNLWGRPERWIDEGLATCSDERWRERVHRAAGELASQGRLLGLEVLFREFLKHPEDVAYVQAGSFTRFLHETYGTAALKRIWRGGHARISKATGHPIDELEREWRAVITSASGTNPRPDAPAPPAHARCKLVP